MRAGRIVAVVVGLILALAITYWPYRPSESETDSPDTSPGTSAEHPLVPKQSRFTSVPNNRGPDVMDGFRGEIHPILHGHTRLEADTRWTAVGQGRDKMEQSLPPDLYAAFHDPKPAKPTALYTERELSAFLPEKIGSAGQLWTLDPEKIVSVLRQFHPSASIHVRARGRRAGPDGAFGILRGLSPDRLDIMCRIHAEFDVTPLVA